VPIDKIPVFLREGGFLPTEESQNYVGEKNIDELNMLIFPSGKSSFRFYEDDGITYNYKNGSYSITEFEQSEDKEHLEVNVVKTTGKFDSKVKYLALTVPCSKQPVKVTFNGAGLDDKNSTKQKNWYSFDSEKSLLYVRVDYLKNIKVEVKFN
jgi:alpha-glucosidase (family GH31 glycosyl hydrolase)